jgi:hypothetical protein
LADAQLPLEGPNSISKSTADSIVDELAARNPAWHEIAAEVQDDGTYLALFLSLDPLSPSEVEDALSAIEEAVSKRIPDEIPVWSDQWSWSAGVYKRSNGALLETTGGGYRTRLPDERHRYTIEPS